MLKLQVNLRRASYADGKYTIKAKGYIICVLRWGNELGPLDEWSPFAYVPIDPNGNGTFYFEGARSIPRDATHVYAHCIASDFSSSEDIYAAIHASKLTYPDNITSNMNRFSVLTDLHLASKPWRIIQSLISAQSNMIFLLGDCVNDGIAAQFTQFEQFIKAYVPDKVILPVIGNHDVTHDKLLHSASNGCKNYSEFQHHLLTHAESKGINVIHDSESLAYSVQIGSIDIIGLQCVISGRKFSFPEGRQIAWLKEHLLEHKGSSWHIILCHAPLLEHNPNRNTGNPYLGKNKTLQELIDSCGNVIFLSGHTHVSPNMLRGNAEHDITRNNIYLDCGSVVDTDTSGESGLMSPDWNNGCITELAVNDNEIEIRMSSIKTGLNFPRGYYRFERRVNHD